MGSCSSVVPQKQPLGSPGIRGMDMSGTKVSDGWERAFVSNCFDNSVGTSTKSLVVAADGPVRANLIAFSLEMDG